MEQKIRVLIIGESPLLEGIVVSLGHDPLLTLQQVPAGKDGPLHLIAEFKPQAIVYQLDCPGLAEVLSQLILLPEVRLVGLDMHDDHVLVMDSWLVDSPSMRELRQLIMAPTASVDGYGVPGQPAGRMERLATEVDIFDLDI